MMNEKALPVNDERDVIIEVAGYQINCLAKFSEGFLYSLTRYKEHNYAANGVFYSGNLMPFLTAEAAKDIEDEYQEALSNER